MRRAEKGLSVFGYYLHNFEYFRKVDFEKASKVASISEKLKETSNLIGCLIDYDHT